MNVNIEFLNDNYQKGIEELFKEYQATSSVEHKNLHIQELNFLMLAQIVSILLRK